MRRRGLPLFCIYTIVFILCAVIGTYADYCVAQGPNSSDVLTYRSVSECSAMVAGVCIICLIPKILQIITGWKFLSFLCIFIAVTAMLTFLLQVFADNLNEPGMIVVAIAVTALSLITIIFEIKELSR